MERMNGLDAVFVAAEDSVNHMHIGSVGIFEGPPPPYEDVRALVASKLQFVPRHRQRVREAPFSVGRPLWIDDIHFNLDYHLRVTALPAHAERRALEVLVGRVMSQPLDRNRPLWEMWVIDGLPDDHWAILSKVHHCMVDGIAGTDLLGVIMDPRPDEPLHPTAEWAPAREPSRLGLGQVTVCMALESVGGVATGLAGAALHPARAWDRVRNIAVGLEHLLAPSPRAGASLTGPIGPHRRWTRTHVSLDDIKTVRHAFGGTVNDVVLTAVSRGFRELLLDRGEPVEDRTVTALIPVSMRAADARGLFDNRVSAVYARLPVGVGDPIECLGAVRAHMDTLKQSHEVDASAAVVGISDFAPPVVAAALARAIVHSQEIVQTVATNVPGPQVPLYVCGRRMQAAYPYVPIAGHIRVGVAIWSYCGDVYFGITGDWDGAPDIEKIAFGIDRAFEDLGKAAASAAV
ncbi:MAG TPA: wax ester/triacylglycerol synthase family O-acyltransferase [Acidimicrobiia bacterium]